MAGTVWSTSSNSVKTILACNADKATRTVLLRSLWTNMRVCWDIKHDSSYMWVAQAIGWGLPAVFLAISLPITGVSYRLGSTCIPNPSHEFVTWFGWLITFACLAAVIQFTTTGFCFVVYMKSVFGHRNSNSGVSSGTSTSGSSTAPVTASSTSPSTPRLGKRLAWRRVRKVLLLQWRSIVLSLLVIVEIVYFGSVYVSQQRKAEEDAQPDHIAQVDAWSICLIASGGDKNQCLLQLSSLSLDEGLVIAKFL